MCPISCITSFLRSRHFSQSWKNRGPVSICRLNCRSLADLTASASQVLCPAHIMESPTLAIQSQLRCLSNRWTHLTVLLPLLVRAFKPSVESQGRKTQGRTNSRDVREAIELPVSSSRSRRMYRVGGTYCRAGELPELFYLPSESWSSPSKVKMSARLSRVQMPTYLLVSVYSAQQGEGHPDHTLI